MGELVYPGGLKTLYRGINLDRLSFGAVKYVAGKASAYGINEGSNPSSERNDQTILKLRAPTKNALVVTSIIERRERYSSSSDYINGVRVA